MKDIVVFSQRRFFEFGLRATVILIIDSVHCYQYVTSCWYLSRNFAILPNSRTNNFRSRVGVVSGVFLCYLQRFVACGVEW
jgi:hypothetical protein